MNATQRPYTYESIARFLDTLHRLRKNGIDDEEKMRNLLQFSINQTSARYGADSTEMHSILDVYCAAYLVVPRESDEIASKPDEELFGEIIGMLERSGVALSNKVLVSVYGGIAFGRWMRSGKKIYELSGGLTQRLEKTRLTGVSSDVVRLPYPSIAIRPAPNLGLPFDELIVSEQDAYDIGPDDVISEQKVGSDTSKIMGRIRNEKRIPRLLRINAAQNSAGKINSAKKSFCVLRLFDGEDLESCIQLSNTDAWNESSRVSLAFALNTVLYMTWPDTGEEFIERNDSRWEELHRRMNQLNGYKKERAKTELKTIIRDHRIFLGAKVSFMSAPEDGNSLGRKLMVRTLVSGHWKMQPHGLERSERKLIRIEPFWRGPMDGLISNPLRKISQMIRGSMLPEGR